MQYALNAAVGVGGGQVFPTVKLGVDGVGPFGAEREGEGAGIWGVAITLVGETVGIFITGRGVQDCNCKPGLNAFIKV